MTQVKKGFHFYEHAVMSTTQLEGEKREDPAYLLLLKQGMIFYPPFGILTRIQITVYVELMVRNHMYYKIHMMYNIYIFIC